MKRFFLFLLFVLFSINLFGQFSVGPDSVTVVLDPNETDGFALLISNLTPYNVSIWMEVNYLTDHSEVSSSNNQDDTWLNINPGAIYNIPPNPMYITMIPVNSNNLEDVVKTAELIVHTDLFGDFTVFVTLIVNPCPTLNPPQNLFVDQFGYATWEAPAPSENRDLFGYNIYLDGCFIAFTSDYIWYYTGLIPGQTYTAGISAVYDGGESDIVSWEFVYVGVYTDDKLVSNEISLIIYPNPFNPSTTISFNVTPCSDPVALEIYNLKGQKVKAFVPSSCHSEPVEGRGTINSYSVVWSGKDDNGSRVSSGVYYCRLRSGNHQEIKKMILMK